jgi:hypothetical protein
LPTPVPVYNFERIPVVTEDPYGYGTPSIPVAAGTATASGTA